MLRASIAATAFVAACSEPALLVVQIASDLPTAYTRTAGRRDPYELTRATGDITAGGRRERVLDEALHTYPGAIYSTTIALEEARYGLGTPIRIDLELTTETKGTLAQTFEVALRDRQLLHLEAYFARTCLTAPPACASGERCTRNGACAPLDRLLREVPRHGVPFH